METTDIYIYINIYVYLRMRTNVYTYVHVYVRTYSKSVNNSRDPHGCETPQSTDKLATQTHKLISAPTDKPPTSRKACKCNGFVYIRTYVRIYVRTYVRIYNADDRRSRANILRVAISNASNERTSRQWARAALFEHAVAPS